MNINLHQEVSDRVEYSRKLESALRAIQREAKKNNPDPDKIHAWATNALLAAA
jgi:hypothetical protein